MQYLTQYSAPPPRSAFAQALTSADLHRAIEQSAIPLDIDDIRAIEHEFSAGSVLIAQDDDGWHFATPDAADDIAVRHDADANTIDWKINRIPRGSVPALPDTVDRAVRQEFAGNIELIRAWERACAAGLGPDGPVGVDGWVSVRLPE